ncbi:GntR family transcriptional regulator [Actinomycetes bacterium KLBMP 9797]
MVRPARRLTLTEDVYASVQALIMDHVVAPGDRINIDALARQLEVSPTPVREALARLEADGLVRKRPLVGYTAAPLLSRGEFEELVEMRLILEPAAAARAAAARLDAGDLRAEADLPDQRTGIAAFTAQDARFHHLLAERAGNRMLHDAIVRLRSHLHLFRLHFPAAHYGISAREHHRIVDAVAAGDPDAASEAMRHHLAAARERHLPYFESTAS